MKEKELRRWILEEAKVNVSFGSSFGMQYEGFIRLNVGTSRKLLKQGLERMAEIYTNNN
ncbi:aminotransferase class I/II-fold pyridoxal phosphate-dependent enzyme [Bacillus sp. N9]